MENNVNYAQQYYPPTELRQEKKPLPAFVGSLVLFFVGVFSVMPISTGDIVANYVLPEYTNILSRLIIINTGYLFANIFYIFLAGLSGFFCYRNFRGALKFMGCLKIGSLLNWVLYYILHGVLYSTSAISSLSDIVTTIIDYVVSPFLCVIFAVIVLIVIDSLEKKPQTSPSVNYNQNKSPIMTKKKKGFSVGKVSAVVLITVVFNTVFYLTSQYLYYYSPIAISYSTFCFLSVLTNLITLICLIALSFPFGKGVKNGISLVGCYASTTYVAEILISLINIMVLVTVNIRTASITFLIDIGTVIIGNLAGALITIGVAALIHKRKEFSEN